jgi:hypothetical protein
LPPGATFGAADKYAEKPSPWPKVLVVAFLVWFIWAYLNDSQGRLSRWTDGKYGYPPSPEVQKQLDQKKTDDRLKKAADEKATATATPASTATNAPAGK